MKLLHLVLLIKSSKISEIIYFGGISHHKHKTKCFFTFLRNETFLEHELTLNKGHVSSLG